MYLLDCVIIELTEVSCLGELLPFKWENAISIDKYSWGYRRVSNITDYYTTTELVAMMVETVSCGGRFENTYTFFLILFFINR